MKLSRFNVLRTIDGHHVFFNSRTCVLAVVDDKFMQVYNDVMQRKFDSNKYDNELVQKMRLSGCLVEDNIDELKDFELHRNIQKYNRNSLSLTIAPTLDCNFKCIYCFENHIHSFMTMDTQVRIVKLLTEKINDIRRFSVTWFGGEPLLAKSTIYTLSEKFITICKAHNVRYVASIITNASLLTDDDVINFKKFNIRRAQITIDGPKKIHDSRRISLNGKSTFNLIVNNVNKLLEAGIRVGVRVNIDKTNVDDVDELLKILDARIINKERLVISFGQVFATQTACKSVGNACFNDEAYANLLVPLYERALSYGFKANEMVFYPAPRYNFCGSNKIDSMVIDPKGNIYKCWNHIGESTEICGSISENGGISISNQYYDWVLDNPLDFEKCRNCNLLPVCAGGCYDKAKRARGRGPVCLPIKYNIDSIMEHYYMWKYHRTTKL